MTDSQRAFAAAMAGFLASSPGHAEDVTLTFRFVTQDAEVTHLAAPYDESRSVGLARSVGTAFFDDGRIAHKQFVRINDDDGDAGTFIGYSTYSFEGGDKLNARFTGHWSATDGVSGDYEVVSGTGAFEGVTGTGHFDGAATDWQGAALYDGRFNLTLPGS